MFRMNIRESCISYPSLYLILTALFTIFSAVAQAQEENPTDPSLSVDAAGAECIIALAMEKAGQQHKSFPDPIDAAFKAGLCTGKMQTYMLRAQAENTACFPKISLEEGMSIFVKWATANPGQSSLDYLTGYKMAFESAIPCLKK